MNPLKKPEMMEATHLTREGRLKEAMELLLGSFGSMKFEATEPRRAPEYPAAKLRLLPPRSGSEHARNVPPMAGRKGEPGKSPDLSAPCSIR